MFIPYSVTGTTSLNKMHICLFFFFFFTDKEAAHSTVVYHSAKSQNLKLL